MSGKLIGAILIGLTLVAGAAMYWLQVYAFYDRLDPAEVEIRLTNAATQRAEAVAVSELQAIDASSSPLRFRACFAVADPAALAARYVVMADAVPLVAPGWFDCFDADAIGAALASGGATGYLAERDIVDGIDRVVAVFGDGRGYAWHQLNEKLQD